VQNHGNTSAASIPLALSVAVSEGKIQPGQVVVTEELAAVWRGAQLFYAGKTHFSVEISTLLTELGQIV